MFTDDFKAAIYLSGKPQWKICQESNLHESVLSRLLNGREKARADDPRLIRIAACINYQGQLVKASA